MRKDKYLRVRVTTEYKAALQRMAEGEEVRPSTLLRRLIAQEAARQGLVLQQEMARARKGA